MTIFFFLVLGEWMVIWVVFVLFVYTVIYVYFSL